MPEDKTPTAEPEKVPGPVIITPEEARNLLVLAMRAQVEVKDIPAVWPALGKLDEAVKAGRALAVLG